MTMTGSKRSPSHVERETEHKPVFGLLPWELIATICALAESSLAGLFVRIDSGFLFSVEAEAAEVAEAAEAGLRLTPAPGGPPS